MDTFSTDPGRGKALVVTARDDIDAAMKYSDAGVNIVRVNLLSGKGTSLAERMETILKLAACKRFAWMVSLHHMYNHIEYIACMHNCTQLLLNAWVE